MNNICIQVGVVMYADRAKTFYMTYNTRARKVSIIL